MFTERDAAMYLAAMIDGEGCVHTYNAAVSIGNTDYEVIQAVERCCEVLDLNYSTYGPRQPKGNRKPYWDVHMRGRRSLQCLLDNVPIQITRKREAIQDRLDSYKYPDRPSKEWLYQKYIEEDMTGPEIGALCGASYARVYKWLREDGVAVKAGSAKPRIEPPSREWLFERYKDRQQSMVSIAEELGVSHTTVYRWLQHYQIPMNHPSMTER